MIGIFDSGIGGLTVVKEILRRYPNADFVYLGDTARAPYGDRSVETICEYAKADVEFLISKNITEIVIACNSVSANCLDFLRSTFPHITFYDVVTPAIEEVVTKNYKRVAILGTRATIASQVYQNKIALKNPNVDVFALACPLFVPWVEEGLTTYGETNVVVNHYLQSVVTYQPDCVVLGCTHYPLLSHHIQETLQPNTALISSSTSLADSLPPYLLESGTGQQHYYFTDVTPHLELLASRWLGKAIKPEPAKL